MRKRLLNPDDGDSVDEVPQHRRVMNVIRLNPKTRVIAVIVIVLAAVIVLMNLPIFSSELEEFHVYDHQGEENERYVSTGSLKFKNRQFLLTGEPLRILSGAVHYFRIPEDYWEDILKKTKAAGLNTIDTYVPWNLHEDRPHIYYFGQNLDIEKFLQKVHSLGLYVILRPGPYICSEWDFGGLPGWLLKDPNMKVRSNYKPYQEAVNRWFSVLIPKIAAYQYSRGGPIIAVQVENEFGSYSSEHDHLMFVKETLVTHGVKEMLLTSDNSQGSIFYNHALPTINFQDYKKGKKSLEYIKSLSPDFPLIVMEFWCGWFDHWGESHQELKTKYILDNFEAILKTGASFSIYMFHGGTNFGFLAGANFFEESNYQPDVTSYDYGAPISEAGDTTPLYVGIRRLLLKYTPVTPGPVPPNREKAAYGKVEIKTFMSWSDMLESLTTLTKDVKVYKKPQPMEYLSMEKTREGYGQNYGYIVYRKQVPKFTKLEIKGTMKDRLQIVVDGRRHTTVLDWKSNYDFTLDVSSLNLKEGNHTLDIMVENLGRVNYVSKGSQVMNMERKGITGDLQLDGQPAEDWTIYPFSFNKNFIHKIYVNDKYMPLSSLTKPPCLFKTDFKIEDAVPKDTFLKMEGWGKGIVFMNEHNLGRYWNIGPQKTLFVPAPFLKAGWNLVIIFEEEKKGEYITFQDHPELS